ncbi:osmotic avoidance abnormal protein 3-like [Athalia rosae]|uniref:osmotic avoidance abnormal protein 3-like n=1 Tax=Athalia rosae TaxID=37344 RepID=UPI002033D782|nr:osmotic avoidance abnormal protein 3-like [Athalia rosae]XP_048509884.1 osmotic avoidance abnormal protein 3-like [Athalia rosae]XP_048509885.1 osmotic avoidance abnormal protein 3-like [Athalia rosae]
MSESVKVALRCRPMSVRELQEGCRSILHVDSATKGCTLENPMCIGGAGGGGGGKMFQFDAVFDPSVSTEVVYEQVGSPIVEAVLDGYNGTVFAYGQTGCGKSFTMRGVVERSLEHLFEATSTSSSETRYLALLSYLEIYNERLRDLLRDGDGDGGVSLLQLKEDPTKGTYVAGGLREVTVKDAAECTRLLEQGDNRRAAAATKMNAASSRSHAVLTLALEAIAINDKQNTAVRKGMLHLVDLAGSERQGRTGATGERLKEAASINLSLSALGNVISALAAGNGRHVPYRDSKLTRLLRDSLGGNARTLMIACVSPSDIDADETLSTLRYAARARCIKNKPVVNEDPKDALLRQYQLELQRLRKLLESNDNLQTELIISTHKVDENKDGDTETQDKTTREISYDEEVQRLRKECENSNLSAQRLQEELENLRSRYEGRANGDGPPDPKEATEDDSGLEKRNRKREMAKKEVLKRLEKLTIGGEARGDEEARRRRERRRKRLEALAGALAQSDGTTEGAVEVYGQLKSTEEALKRAMRRSRQLEAENADLQASWDAERRDLLRRELLATQLCDAMIPYLRPGCPLRDIEAVRAAASWCEELSRWRLPDISPRIPLPPPSLSQPVREQEGKPSSGTQPDHNNNDNNNNTVNDAKPQDIADAYFRRSRVDALLAHAREAKNRIGERNAKQNQEYTGRQSKSGGSGESGIGANSYLQLNALNLQSSAPPIPASISTDSASKQFSNSQFFGRTALSCNWLLDDVNSKPIDSNQGSATIELKKMPPRILEALPSYPLRRVRLSPTPVAVCSPRHELDSSLRPHHARSPTY